ncbi:hypothetical protein Ciccas_008222 [Cichlidogyrus casuarinus]|uniref:Uncharacterized protein n=1 Tax=Cichlidogyrus casuarinus TaxID=1844966 RepID=A0ABD2Q375_9PLAT
MGTHSDFVVDWQLQSGVVPHHVRQTGYHMFRGKTQRFAETNFFIQEIVIRSGRRNVSHRLVLKHAILAKNADRVMVF